MGGGHRKNKRERTEARVRKLCDEQVIYRDGEDMSERDERREAVNQR